VLKEKHKLLSPNCKTESIGNVVPVILKRRGTVGDDITVFELSSFYY
jgi:hypothetical protein